LEILLEEKKEGNHLWRFKRLKEIGNIPKSDEESNKSDI
jgi:hypothetical protein